MTSENFKSKCENKRKTVKPTQKIVALGYKPTLIYKNTLLYAMGTSVKEIHE
jgi:hypothetical protein